MYVIITFTFITFKQEFSSQYGNTVLHWAAKGGHSEVVKLLVQSQANLNIKNYVSP